MLASAHFVRKIVKAQLAAESAVDVISFSGQQSHRYETSDPEYGQDDRKQK